MKIYLTIYFYYLQFYNTVIVMYYINTANNTMHHVLEYYSH